MGIDKYTDTSSSLEDTLKLPRIALRVPAGTDEHSDTSHTLEDTLKLPGFRIPARHLPPETSSVWTRERGMMHIECLHHYFEQTCDQRPGSIAVICGPSQLTYLELDHRANRLAHLLRERGAEEGTRVGIFLNRSLDMYAALLGALKAGATYVPLDPSLPTDRLAFIAQDAGLRFLVTTSALRDKTCTLPCHVLELDEAAAQLARQPATRPYVHVYMSSICYIIYTSGFTNQPRGVAISHASIVNFLRVFTPIYDVRNEDRVYQGMSLTSDLSFEEIWPAWIAGATLIAGPSDSQHVGQALNDFLIERQITVFCCMPTLLATIESDVPSLRCLLVGGEVCSADLVHRWARPDRRMLITYGPTETTVAATCCELRPGQPVTLGIPLPTYRVYILDEQLHPVQEGRSGEICIGSPGVAIGYHNRPDLTAERFVSNPVTSDQAEVPRIYRTGDRGRFTSSGAIEYLGHIDNQIEIAGYRIEQDESKGTTNSVRAAPQGHSTMRVYAGDAAVLPDLASESRSSTDLILVCPEYEQTIRWRNGERLDHLFEDKCDWMQKNGQSDHLAVDTDEVALTYRQLDARANQLARYLLTQGARPGDRIALLFDQALYSYIGMLAVLKINAAYIPLDIGFPPDRLSYILQDAGVQIALSQSHLRDRLEHTTATLLCIDDMEAVIATQDDHRLTDEEKGNQVDELCYIIYTSGSTGRPKGVAIQHASICNFVRIAVEVYGIESQDRVYQGMTIAFDFSVEEIWVPLLAGATLVPKPGGSTLLGHELWEFLQTKGITALCCVPTLLATLEEDLPGLRFLLVSGEACPQDLIVRWYRFGRRFLNVYGPTETTVTATWSVVHPSKAVTLGVPLPTYSVVILDPVEPKALPPGEMGEIGIAGIGLASGYVKRDDLTERAFIRDFLGIKNNPSARIYRTGDLGRVNDEGEIEYHGRIDTQVKIRGYRIELSEIESVLLQVPGIAQAVVNTYEPEQGVIELVAYYSRRKDTANVDQEQVYEHLRERLPSYMIPAYLEELAVIPMLPSNKADRKSLPAPKGPRTTAAQHSYAAPTTETEKFLADAMAHTMRLERVSVDSHFFDDLGANSLLLARFCSRVRERAGSPPMSMKDVYLHPTIRSLAAALEDAAPAPDESQVPVLRETAARMSTWQYILCGILQCLLFLGYSSLIALVMDRGYEWISASTGLLDIYVRSFIFSSASSLGLCIAPILAKWILVGRWKAQEIRIWSLAYVRFWAVKTLIQLSPLVLFVDSPLYILYLRALGARIGRGVAIFSQHVPVCTDLLTIGDNTVIRKDSFFTCYRAHAGLIQTGPVTLGKDVFISEKTVIDIWTAMGDGTQLGHASALLASQAVPDGQHWHGTPAQRTDTDFRAVAPTKCGTLRKVAYSTLLLLSTEGLSGLVIGTAIALIPEIGLLTGLLSLGSLALTSWTFYCNVLTISFVLFFGLVLAGLAFVFTVPRLLNLALKPDVVYPLYGFRYWLQRMIALLTNIKFFTDLFGDSSYIVYYLRALGYDLCQIVQTGSNFGPEVKHETPYLSTIGTGTMVSDGLSIMNADFSSTSFRMSRASIGARNFLGNDIVYPAGSRTGENCLLATKVMVPIDGDVRENVGLLGSPCFEIPRSVQRDSRFDYLKSGDELRRRLAAKNKYNIVTMALFLLAYWLQFFGIALLTLVTADLYLRFHALAITVDLVLTLVFTAGYSMLIERASAGFRSLSPRFCSIYEPYFWWHERVWKFLTPSLALFNGTPFKNVIWRLLGVRIGNRVYDDGCDIPERTLVTIGDDCTLNAGSAIQCHSLEDGTFKSDYITIGAGCTVGIEGFVHYGVTMGDGAVLDADSFLMKGTEVVPGARWRGNPASEFRGLLSVDPLAVAPQIAAAPARTGVS